MSGRRYIGRQNLDALVADYMARGGAVTKCEPGDADAPMRKLTRVRTGPAPAPGRGPMPFDDTPYLNRWTAATERPAEAAGEDSAAA